MKKRRLLAGALLGLVLSPGTMLRTQIPPISQNILEIARVTDLPDARSDGGFTRGGVWQLSSPQLHFGGYSAMLTIGSDTLRAFSDRGDLVTFAVPGQRRQGGTQYAAMWNRGNLSHTNPDIEAATRDQITGDYWLAFEDSNAIIRYSLGSRYIRSRRPPEWQGWSENSGAEAMARLPDGRFLILPERNSTGLFYPSDPTADVAPIKFSFSVPGGYNPTDMAALPDGRVLILLRRLDWAWPPFNSAIAIADPRELADGAELGIDMLVQLETILPHENYEALTLAGVEDDGAVRLWLMSDDNLSAFQRTLLAQLTWREQDADGAHEKAREE